MTEAKALQSHPAKSAEAMHHATAASDASAALLADAQRFSITLAMSGHEAPTGGYTTNTDVMTLPGLVNDKMNAVNGMSSADRKTWLHDFQIANGQSDYNSDPGIGMKAPVRLDLSTGANGKVTDFQITTANYDRDIQPSSAVLDGTVGASGAQNVHFDAARTQPGFVADEISGLDFSRKNSQYPVEASQVSQWAAEAQAMPLASRTAMIQEAKKAMPTATWNTDAQGSLASVDFGGQQITPEKWGQSVQNDSTADARGAARSADDLIAERKSAARSAGDDDYYYGGTGSGAGGSRSSGGSSNSESYPANGTVVQGVGADSGLYISNGDGSVSKW